MSITNWMLIRCSGCADNSNCVKFESFQQQITALGTDAKCGRKFNLRSTLHDCVLYEGEQKYCLEIAVANFAGCLHQGNKYFYYIQTFKIHNWVSFALLLIYYNQGNCKSKAFRLNWYKILDYLIFKKIIVIIKFWKWCAKLKYNHNTM